MLKNNLSLFFLMMLTSLNAATNSANSPSGVTTLHTKSPMLASIDLPPVPNPSAAYKEIQSLRALGQIDRAIALGQTYLNTYPKDADVILLVGLMFYQKKDFAAADQYLTQVLTLSPNYLDAQLGLINIKIAENQLPQAAVLIAQANEQAPNDPRVQAIQISFNKLQEQANKSTSPEKTPLVVPAAIAINKPPVLAAQPSPLKQIGALRAQGKLNEGSWLGRNYLKTHPKDTDVMLQVGLILSQQKKYSEAADYLHQILKISPNYLDAKFGLINLAMAQNQMHEAAVLIKQVQQQAPNDPRVRAVQLSYKKTQEQNKLNALDTLYKQGNFNQATLLANQYLSQDPHDTNTRLMLGHIYLIQKQYQQAQTQFQRLLTQDPKNKVARLALIDVAFSAGHDKETRLLIKQALVLYPHDPDFLNQQATLYVIRHQYARAASLDQKVVADYPNYKPAKALLDEIGQVNPHLLYGLNEVGINSEIDYISDLHSAWQYSTAYYNHDTPWGLTSLNLNNATRLGVTSNQGAINLFPVISKNSYMRLTGAYANQPLLFPTYMGGIEPYFIGGPAELSFGANYSYILPNITFVQYTASVSKEWKNYWLSFRPNYYVPAHGTKSTLYTGTLIRYFGPKDTFARLTLGSGTTPDLANLTTVDFIVIKNNFVTFNVQYPIINHSFLFTIGGDYQHWVFPNSRVRNISGMTIGFNYRFQGPKL